MAQDEIWRIQKILSQAVDEKVFPGSVVGLVTKKESEVIPVGRYTYDPDSPMLSENSIFDVASITKTIPTSLLALKLIEDGKISLEDKVNKFLPNIKGRWKDQIKIIHLLTQTVDYGISLSDFKNKTPKEILKVIMRHDLKERPGETYSYTNSSSILLGKVIETVEGDTLDNLADKILFRKLKMKDTTFSPKKSDINRIVPTEIDPWRKVTVRGIVHDESAYVLSQESFVGSAGLFTTVPDLLNLLLMVINDGMFEGVRILNKKTIDLMGKNYLLGLNRQAGLGWELNSNYMGASHSGEVIGKSGFTGCFIACEIVKKRGLVMLSNYHFPKRQNDFGELNKVRRIISDLVFSN